MLLRCWINPTSCCQESRELSATCSGRHTLRQSKIAPEKWGLEDYNFNLGWLPDRCYVSFEGSLRYIRMAEAVLAQNFVLQIALGVESECDSRHGGVACRSGQTFPSWFGKVLPH